MGDQSEWFWLCYKLSQLRSEGAAEIRAERWGKPTCLISWDNKVDLEQSKLSLCPRLTQRTPEEEEKRKEEDRSNVDEDGELFRAVDS